MDSLTELLWFLNYLDPQKTGDNNLYRVMRQNNLAPVQCRLHGFRSVSPAGRAGCLHPHWGQTLQPLLPVSPYSPAGAQVQLPARKKLGWGQGKATGSCTYATTTCPCTLLPSCSMGAASSPYSVPH